MNIPIKFINTLIQHFTRNHGKQQGRLHVMSLLTCWTPVNGGSCKAESPAGGPSGRSTRTPASGM